MSHKLLAKLSNTPEHIPGSKTFEVHYRTAEDASTQHDLLRLTRKASVSPQLGTIIRRHVFDRHPDATDYSFTEFNYPNLQREIIRQKWIPDIDILAQMTQTWMMMYNRDKQVTEL